jgi:hypothetical protein
VSGFEHLPRQRQPARSPRPPCHLRARVTRTGYDGTITVLMDKFEGKRLNSPPIKLPSNIYQKKTRILHYSNHDERVTAQFNRKMRPGLHTSAE